MNKMVTLKGRASQTYRRQWVRQVAFLFGVAGREDLPGVALVRLLGALGLSEAAARGLIARMRADGLLTATPDGRGRRYHLAGSFAQSFRRIRSGAAGQPMAWDGFFHALLYQVPETERAFRDRLRRQAVFAGYGILQPGILICPSDRRTALQAPLAEAPSGAVVQFARLELAPADAARAASEAWDLDELNRCYRVHADRLRAAVDAVTGTGPPPASGETLRMFAELLSPALVDLLRSPALPLELFPSAWSLPDLHAAIGPVQQTFGPPAAAFVRQVWAPA